MTTGNQSINSQNYDTNKLWVKTHLSNAFEKLQVSWPYFCKNKQTPYHFWFWHTGVSGLQLNFAFARHFPTDIKKTLSEKLVANCNNNVEVRVSNLISLPSPWLLITEKLNMNEIQKINVWSKEEICSKIWTIWNNLEIDQEKHVESL